MSGKTISTGTLSLKFMQNAHRAKHLKEVEAERAQVQDEAQWELPTARSALAAAPLTANTATHEASYLPFLFDSQVETETEVAHRPKGRRVFGKKGTEMDEPEPDAPAAPPQPIPPSETASSSKRAPPGVSPLSARAPKSTVRKDPRTARQLIRDTGGVGADLRARPTRAQAQVQQGFMKPAGVDEPGAAGRVPGEDDVIVLGARGRAKRGREANADQQQQKQQDGDDAPGPGRKRKKSGAA